MTANGQQTEPDPKQIEEVKAEAEIGDAKAQYDLGLCYARGQGVAKDEVEAVKWFRKAAEQNVAKAQAALGFSYADGTGVAKDEVEAVKWFRRAAEQNVAEAQYMLASCYYKGQGVARDQVESVKWARKAAEQNVAEAQATLGFNYATGQGVAKNYVQAYAWFLLAAGQGHVDAKNNMTILKDKMTPEQIAEGQKLARDFKPSSVSVEPPAAIPAVRSGTASAVEKSPFAPNQITDTFGLTIDTPIPASSISASTNYVRHLATPDLKPVKTQRIGSFGSPRFKHPIDKYDVRDSDDRFIYQIFVYAYSQDTTRAPQGLVYHDPFGEFLKTKEGQKAAADLRKAVMANPQARAQLEKVRQLQQLVTGHDPARKGSGCFAVILAAALFTGFIALLIIR